MNRHCQDVTGPRKAGHLFMSLRNTGVADVPVDTRRYGNIRSTVASFWPVRNDSIRFSYISCATGCFGIFQGETSGGGQTRQRKSCRSGIQCSTGCCAGLDTEAGSAVLDLCNNFSCHSICLANICHPQQHFGVDPLVGCMLKCFLEL